MSVDKSTKGILIAIALGLWMNVAGAWLHPQAVFAEGSQVQYDRIIKALEEMANALNWTNAHPPCQK